MDVDEVVVSDGGAEMTAGPMLPSLVLFKVHHDPQLEASTLELPISAEGSSSSLPGDPAGMLFDPTDVELGTKAHDEAWRRHTPRRAPSVIRHPQPATWENNPLVYGKGERLSHSTVTRTATDLF
jgi:hypothetical protein